MEGMASILSAAQSISVFGPYVVITIFIVELLRQSGKIPSWSAPYIAFLAAWVIMFVYDVGESGLSWVTPLRAIMQGSQVAVCSLALYDTVGKPIKKAVRSMRRKKI